MAEAPSARQAVPTLSVLDSIRIAEAIIATAKPHIVTAGRQQPIDRAPANAATDTGAVRGQHRHRIRQREQHLMEGAVHRAGVVQRSSPRRA
ncbi:hypothetical protein [Rhodococcus opacus]|uniref:hypothetical protein n=1 Tax=Rhodococcus opacus TaxID=37919 RepID=UPI001C46EC8C|nr:hypothetical protein [Rhodococcus opacus]MBV6763050.1 hypothetical protein [Rhodococcus opacus]